MFIPTEDDTFVRLDDVASISASRKDQGAVLVLRDGSKVSTWLSAEAVYRATQPVIAAGAGFQMLAYVLDGESKPENYKPEDEVERSTVVAWRLDPANGPTPIALNNATGEIIVGDARYAVLDPTGMVAFSDACFMSVEGWAQVMREDATLLIDKR